MKYRTRFTCFLIAALVLLVPDNGNSCGPTFPEAVFTYQRHPGAPLKQYAEGTLGVVLPEFDHSYLVIAYRYYSQRPLSTNEVNQSFRYWRWKMEGYWTKDQEKGAAPIQEWIAARKLIAGETANPPEIIPHRQFGNYVVFENCLPDAFRTAAFTLKDRVQRFTGSENELKEWLHGQDIVFGDCESQKIIPPAVPESSPQWLKADRRYQIAAAHFYSGEFDETIQQFDSIAQDSNSPWHTIAPYLAVRTILRKATLQEESGRVVDAALLKQANERLLKITRDPAQAAIHDAARKLLGYVAIRVDPEGRTRQLARQLSARDRSPDFYQDLIDYGEGLHKMFGDSPDFWAQEAATRATVAAQKKKWRQEQYAKIAMLQRQDDLTDWLITFRDSGQRSRNHAVSQWRRLQTMPWLVAAITKVDAGDQAADELLRAAAQAPESSPALPMLAYHRIRLMLQHGETEQAHALLSDVLPRFAKTLTASSLNLFLKQQLQLAANFHDFLAHSALPVVDWDYNDSGGEGTDGSCGRDCNELFFGAPKKQIEQRFDRQTAMVFNLRLPTELLMQAALGQGEELPRPMRKEIALATWTRAALLGQYDLADKLVPVLEQDVPAMKAELQTYGAAQTENEKRHAALFLILQYPGTRPYVGSNYSRATAINKIDSYRENWWCAGMGGGFGDLNWAQDYGPSDDAGGKVENGKFKEPKDAPPYPVWLSSEQRDQARSQWQGIVKLGASASYLARETLKWAGEDPKDARIPAALHFAVRATHYGCDDHNNSKLGRQAFVLLHSRYGNSKWAKETPYWY